MESDFDIKQYNIYLNFDVKKLTYSGNVEILVKINRNIKSMELDSKKLNIDKVQLNNINCNYKYSNNKIVINSDYKKNDEFSIKVDFYREIGINPDGIYWTKSMETKSNNNLMICTNLEPEFAREFIPCFDSPDKKSIFVLHIETDLKYNCVSNSSIESIELIGIKNKIKRKITKFKPTPVMSVYLLCLVLGNIQPILLNPIITKNKIKINGYLFKEDKPYALWAISYIEKSLNFFEDFFNIKYSQSGLDKLDIICINKFSSAAMENWGLIVFSNDYY